MNTETSVTAEAETTAHDPATMQTPDLLHYIAELQQIQKTHSTRTPAWQTASELLQPCFAEMARREGSR
jgi:hypothetical protein